VVYNTNSEMEAELIKAYLNNADIEVQVMSQCDHMLPVHAFDSQLVHVLVEPENVEKAKSFIAAFLASRGSQQPEEGGATGS